MMFSGLAGKGRNKRHELAVQTSLPHEESRRHGHAHPTILEHVDCKRRTARSEFMVDAQVVVDAGERHVDRRRCGFAFCGEGSVAERTIFVDADDHPARRK